MDCQVAETTSDLSRGKISPGSQLPKIKVILLCLTCKAVCHITKPCTIGWKQKALCVCSRTTSLQDNWHVPLICTFITYSSISLPEMQSDSSYLHPQVGEAQGSDGGVVTLR